MSADAGWRKAVEDNRASLERIAEHGQTELADHIRAVLEEYDADNGNGSA